MQISQTFPHFKDIDGSPLDNGYIYFGEAGLNPETNPIAVYWDEALTQPAAQPVRTLSGNTVRNGTVSNIYAAQDYSLTVRNKNSLIVYYVANASKVSNSIQCVSSVAILRTIGVSSSRDIETQGYYTKGDGGHGTYYGVTGASAGTYTDDGFKTIVPTGGNGSSAWLLKHNGRLLARQAGAKGDGATLDTARLLAAAQSMVSGEVLDFEDGTYLISATGAATHQSGAAYGKVVMPFTGKARIGLIGDGATIKCVDHDTSTGGLTFANFKGCQQWEVRVLRFDMTFTGINTANDKYPFCGAISAIDDSAAGQAQAALNGNGLVRDCRFKLYHPYGSYGQSGTTYLGDSNNGFKVFSVFASGPYLATSYGEQCRNIEISRCTWEDGHNAYGAWVWAWNNVRFLNNTAEAWVSKYSLSNGSYGGAGIPMFRYHQWHCTGVKVLGNSFRAKPCDERTGAFQGSAQFCALNGSNLGDLSHGQSIARKNTIILGNGDAANTAFDYGIRASTYGMVDISANEFDGIATTTNAYGSASIYYEPETTGGNGSGSFVASGNQFGLNLSYDTNIQIANGSSVAESQRRAKSILIKGNISMSQAQYFLDMTAGSAATHLGSRSTIISDNEITGTYNTVFNAASTNSRSYRLAATETTDILRLSGGVIRDKYEAFRASNVNNSADAIVEGVQIAGVTTYFTGGSGIVKRHNTGYVTEKRGSGSIASGATSVTVNHGLAAAPAVVNITFLEQGTADYGRWWVSNVTATQFTLNVSADPGVSNLDFAWEARTW